MAAEIPGQPPEPRSGPLSSVQGRQTWRPPAVRAAASLMATITRRHRPFVQHASRLSAWYEQCTARMQPWSGWLPLSLELRPEVLLPTEYPHVPEVVNRSSSLDSEGSGSASISTNKMPAPLAQRSAAPALHTIITPPPAAPSLYRPALRLATLRRVHSTIAATASRGPGRHPSHTPELGLHGRVPGRNWQPLFAAPQQWAHDENVPESRFPFPWARSPQEALWRALLAPLTSVPEPRLSLTISPSPRQEVQGGFPSQPLPSVNGSETAHIPAAPLLAPLRITHETFLSSPLQQAVARVGAVSAPGAIEELMERTVLPGLLPGLELRLVPPDQPVPATHWPLSSATESGQPTEEKSQSPGPATSTPPIPQLDIEAVADRVYHTLRRREQVERERRGLY
jgi:hypothetical protein